MFSGEFHISDYIDKFVRLGFLYRYQKNCRLNVRIEVASVEDALNVFLRYSVCVVNHVFVLPYLKNKLKCN